MSHWCKYTSFLNISSINPQLYSLRWSCNLATSSTLVRNLGPLSMIVVNSWRDGGYGQFLIIYQYWLFLDQDVLMIVICTPNTTCLEYCYMFMNQTGLCLQESNWKRQDNSVSLPPPFFFFRNRKQFDYKQGLSRVEHYFHFPSFITANYFTFFFMGSFSAFSNKALHRRVFSFGPIFII